MKASRKLTSLFIFAFILSGIEAQAEEASNMPEIGSRLEYNNGYGDGNRIETILGTEMVNGVLTYINKREEAAPDNYHQKMWFGTEGDEVFIYKFWSNMGPDPAIVFDTPASVGPVQKSVGDTWTMVFDFGDIQFSATSVVESVSETVTVPAGTFSGCTKVRTFEEVAVDGATEYEYVREWSAPSVGKVMKKKYSANWATEERSQELVNYSNIGLLNLDLNANKDIYTPGDTLRTTLSIYNSGDCEEADLYVGIKLPNDTVLYMSRLSRGLQTTFPSPQFIPRPRPTSRQPLSICGSPSRMHDFPLFTYTIPASFKKGTYTWIAVLTEPGQPFEDEELWLSYDEAPFTVE